jgi:hypothetical protein
MSVLRQKVSKNNDLGLKNTKVATERSEIMLERSDDYPKGEITNRVKTGGVLPFDKFRITKNSPGKNPLSLTERARVRGKALAF